MKTMIASVCLLLAATMSAEGADDWREFAADEATVLVQALSVDSDLSPSVTRHADGSVTVTAGPEGASSIPLGTFPIEAMASETYAVQLWVDHSIPSLEPGHFVMWTATDDGKQFFSKSLADTGAMAKLVGVSQGREVILPASLAGADVSATQCSLSVVLPPNATVTIHKARMLDVPAGLRLVAAIPNQWYPGWMGGMIGAIFGVVCGCLGSFYGYSYRSGMAWSAMQYFPVVMGITASVFLVAGLSAVVVKQPYHVWYPLVLIGVLGVVLAPTIPWQMKKQQSQSSASFEDRRMQAMDV